MEFPDSGTRVLSAIRTPSKYQEAPQPRQFFRTPGKWIFHRANIIGMTPITAMSGKSLFIFYAPGSREVVDLPRIYIHHDPGSTSLDQEDKIQESSDPARDSQQLMEAMHRGSEAWWSQASSLVPKRAEWVQQRCSFGSGSCGSLGAVTGDGCGLGHGDLYNLNINGTVRNWAVCGSCTWKSNDLIMWPLEVEVVE